MNGFALPPSRGPIVADRIVRVLLALVFAGAGGAKLAGVPALVQAFDAIGFGQWLRFVTGALELAGGVLVLVPGAARFGALLLACIMIGATVTNLVLIEGSVFPPLALLALCGLAFYLQTRRLAGARR